MSQPSPLARTLRSLTDTSKKQGLALRPSKKLLRLLHLAREYAAAVAFRPISFGNLRYLQERVEELHLLGREIQTMLPSLANEWRIAATRISNALLQCTNNDSQRSFASIVQACDSTRYKRFWERTTTPIPAYQSPVLTKNYNNIIVITGPAIGLGDEISCADFMRHLRATWPLAQVDIYGFYTGLWQTVDPTFTTHAINGDPLRCFAAIDDSVHEGKQDSTLVLFINFTGLSFHLLFCTDTHKPDIVEIAVGRGTAWFASGKGGPIQVLSEYNTIYPNNYTSLHVLTKELLGGAQQYKLHTVRTRPESDEYRIVINPLTSKPIILTPTDWALLIGSSFASVPDAKPIRCIVLPGLAQQSWDYAKATANEIQNLHLPHCTADVLNGNAPLDSATAFKQVTRCVETADILIGIDTYTAHLAPMLSIPSIALCYERNIAFWSPSDKAFWVELQHNVGFLTEVVSLIMRLTGASRKPDTALLPDAELLYALQEKTDKTPVRAIHDIQAIIEAYDAVWNALPLQIQRIIGELDQNYAWPVMRSWLSALLMPSGGTPWILHILGQSHFSKLCRLMAAHQRSVE